VAPRCTSSQGPCAPEPGTPFLVTTNYADPDVVRFDPVLALDGDDASRTIKYCATYDNGFADPSTVKRRSTSPLTPLGTSSCTDADTACLAGPHEGEKCNANDAVCDSQPGLGDGLCDACTLHGGVTTDDEMFALLGSYYCEHGSDCEATLQP
jgi:hypothetical protein